MRQTPVKRQLKVVPGVRFSMFLCNCTRIHRTLRSVVRSSLGRATARLPTVRSSYKRNKPDVKSALLLTFQSSSKSTASPQSSLSLTSDDNAAVPTQSSTLPRPNRITWSGDVNSQTDAGFKQPSSHQPLKASVSTGSGARPRSELIVADDGGDDPSARRKRQAPRPPPVASTAANVTAVGGLSVSTQQPVTLKGVSVDVGSGDSRTVTNGTSSGSSGGANSPASSLSSGFEDGQVTSPSVGPSSASSPLALDNGVSFVGGLQPQPSSPATAEIVVGIGGGDDSDGTTSRRRAPEPPNNRPNLSRSGTAVAAEDGFRLANGVRRQGDDIVLSTANATFVPPQRPQPYRENSEQRRRAIPSPPIPEQNNALPTGSLSVAGGAVGSSTFEPLYATVNRKKPSDITVATEDGGAASAGVRVNVDGVQFPPPTPPGATARGGNVLQVFDASDTTEISGHTTSKGAESRSNSVELAGASRIGISVRQDDGDRSGIDGENALRVDGTTNSVSVHTYSVGSLPSFQAERSSNSSIADDPLVSPSSSTESQRRAVLVEGSKNAAVSATAMSTGQRLLVVVNDETDCSNNNGRVVFDDDDDDVDYGATAYHYSDASSFDRSPVSHRATTQSLAHSIDGDEQLRDDKSARFQGSSNVIIQPPSPSSSSLSSAVDNAGLQPGGVTRIQIAGGTISRSSSNVSILELDRSVDGNSSSPAVESTTSRQLPASASGGSASGGTTVIRITSGRPTGFLASDKSAVAPVGDTVEHNGVSSRHMVEETVRSEKNVSVLQADSSLASLIKSALSDDDEIIDSRVKLSKTEDTRCRLASKDDDDNDRIRQTGASGTGIAPATSNTGQTGDARSNVPRGNNNSSATAADRAGESGFSVSSAAVTVGGTSTASSALKNDRGGAQKTDLKSTTIEVDATSATVKTKSDSAVAITVNEIIPSTAESLRSAVSRSTNETSFQRTSTERPERPISIDLRPAAASAAAAEADKKSTVSPAAASAESRRTSQGPPRATGKLEIRSASNSPSHVPFGNLREAQRRPAETAAVNTQANQIRTQSGQTKSMNETVVKSSATLTTGVSMTSNDGRREDKSAPTRAAVSTDGRSNGKQVTGAGTGARVSHETAGRGAMEIKTESPSAVLTLASPKLAENMEVKLDRPRTAIQANPPRSEPKVDEAPAVSVEVAKYRTAEPNPSTSVQLDANRTAQSPKEIGGKQDTWKNLAEAVASRADSKDLSALASHQTTAITTSRIFQAKPRPEAAATSPTTRSPAEKSKADFDLQSPRSVKTPTASDVMPSGAERLKAEPEMSAVQRRYSGRALDGGSQFTVTRPNGGGQVSSAKMVQQTSVKESNKEQQQMPRVRRAQSTPPITMAMAATVQDDADAEGSTTGVYYGGVKLKQVSRQPSSGSTVVTSAGQKAAAEAGSATPNAATSRSNRSVSSDTKHAEGKPSDTRPADSPTVKSVTTQERTSVQLSAVRRPNAASANANGAAGTGKEQPVQAMRSVELSRVVQSDVRRDASLTVTSLELQRSTGGSAANRTTEREADRIVRTETVKKSNDFNSSEPAERPKLRTASAAAHVDQVQAAAAAVDGKTSLATERGATCRTKPEHGASSNTERRTDGSRTFYGHTTSAIDTPSASKGTKTAAGAGADTKMATAANRSLKSDSSNSASADDAGVKSVFGVTLKSRSRSESNLAAPVAELSVAPSEKTQTAAADILRRGSGVGSRPSVASEASKRSVKSDVREPSIQSPTDAANPGFLMATVLQPAKPRQSRRVIEPPPPTLHEQLMSAIRSAGGSTSSARPGSGDDSSSSTSAQELKINSSSASETRTSSSSPRVSSVASPTRTSSRQSTASAVTGSPAPPPPPPLLQDSPTVSVAESTKPRTSSAKYRLLDPPKLTPREELMLAIRNAAGSAKRKTQNGDDGGDAESSVDATAAAAADVRQSSYRYSATASGAASASSSSSTASRPTTVRANGIDSYRNSAPATNQNGVSPPPPAAPSISALGPIAGSGVERSTSTPAGGGKSSSSPAVKSTRSLPPQPVEDPREQLLAAIRNAAGGKTLRKVSSRSVRR